MDLPLWKKKAQEYVQQTSIKEVSYNISQQSFTKKKNVYFDRGYLSQCHFSWRRISHLPCSGIYFWAQLSEGRLALNPGLNQTWVSFPLFKSIFLDNFLR